MAAGSLDALLVCGNQYSGFEGAVRYVSGFEIVHRYAYVLLPARRRSHSALSARGALDRRQEKALGERSRLGRVPGNWMREHADEQRWKRLGVYGLDYIMAVRDYRELAGGAFELVPFDFRIRHGARGEERGRTRRVRDSMEIIADGFWAWSRATSPGRTEAEIMAPGGGALLRPRRRPAHDEHRAFGHARRSRGPLQSSRPARVVAPTICCFIRWKSPARTATGSSSRARLIQRQTERAHAANGAMLSRGARSRAQADARRRTGQQRAPRVGRDLRAHTASRSATFPATRSA